MRTDTPSYMQRICLSVLAQGGYMDPGVFGKRAPHLHAWDGRLWAVGMRSTLDVMLRRGWVRQRQTDGCYVLSEAGQDAARRYTP